MYAVNTLVGFAIALAFMAAISPRLTLYAMIPMALLPPVVVGFGGVIHRRFEKIQEQYSTLSNMVQENLTGVRIVRAYVQERDQAGQFDVLNREYQERNMGLARVSSLLHPVLGLLTGVALVIVLWVGGREVISGTMSAGDYVAFFFYLGFLVWPMIALGWVVNLFQRGAASMARMNEILETEPALAVPAEPAPAAGLSGEVEFRDVSFRYPGTERWVLRGVSFRASPGETVAVVGPTGSGKSTLVALIPRLYDPQEGAVLLDGVPLTRYDPLALRGVMGVVPQDPFLFSDTILENIALGLRRSAPAAGSGSTARSARTFAPDPPPRPQPTLSADAAPEPELEEVVEEAATVAQLHESITGFPSGYHTLLGERGINLSGGQKQRATLARAVARDPRVLILDDALSAVDTQTEARILTDLRQVMRGRTSFIISHRVSAVMHADQILVLEDGRIVERGKHAQLLARGGTYARLLRRQLLEQDLEEDALPAAGD
jgi:ATP-binding cassette subfamily B protein